MKPAERHSRQSVQARLPNQPAAQPATVPGIGSTAGCGVGGRGWFRRKHHPPTASGRLIGTGVTPMPSTCNPSTGLTPSAAGAVAVGHYAGCIEQMGVGSGGWHAVEGSLAAVAACGLIQAAATPGERH